MPTIADGAKATLLLGMEQALDGYQIGMPFLRTAEVAGPTTALTATPGSTGLVTGAQLSYKYSRVTIGRGETECSAASTPAAVTTKIVALSDLVWGADPEVDALKIYRQLVTGGAWLHIGTVWDSTHVATTYSDNLAPGSEGTDVPLAANETANNWGLREMPIDPGQFLKIEAVEVVPNELTGFLGEPDGIPIRVEHSLEGSASLRSGHLVPYVASQLGVPASIVRSATEPVWTFAFTPKEDSDDAISLDGIFHLGGAVTRPMLFMGGRIADIEIGSPGNTELQVKVKGVACSSSESSPGYPAVGNSGTNTLAPVLRGKRSDALAYTKSVFRNITTGPSAGTFAQKFKVDTGGTLGSAITEHYDTVSKRAIRYGSQDEPSVEVLVGTANDPLGYDDGENKEPLSCVSPGDLDLYANADAWEFLPEILIADSKVAAAYSGVSRIKTEQIRYTPARVRVMRGLSSANDYMEFTALTVKTSRSILPVPGHGQNAKRARNLMVTGFVKLELGLTQYVESREFERYTRGATRLFWDVLIEGPRIWVNPGVRSTTRESIRFQVPHGQIKQAYTVPNGPVTQVITVMAKQPADGSAVFTQTIVTGMGWDFTAIR